MRFLIIGAGGIGCYYGARLQQQGHSVCYLARGAHLEAMQTTGLTVLHDDFSYQEAVTAVDLETLLQSYSCDQFDMILLTLKTGATESILKQLANWLTDSYIPLLSLQNGVDNEPQIEAALGRYRTIGGLAVRIGGHIVEPGVIEARGPAQVIMGSWPNHRSEGILNPASLEILAEQFNAAEIPTIISPDIRYELWRKLLINNGVNPLSALTGLDTRSLTSHPSFGKTVYRMMQETAAVAPTDDVSLSKEDVDEMFELISNFAAIKTSMLVDKEKGRPLELDGISGAVLKRAAQLGIDVPCTELVYALLLEQEKEQLEQHQKIVSRN